MKADPTTDSAPVEPRGRKRSHAKRKLIVDAAEHLFIELGYDAASMDKVAERAGVSKQTVYSHFGNKDALFRQCIQSKCIVSTLSAEFIDENAPTRDSLLELARRVVQLVISQEGVSVMRICVGSAETHPEIANSFYEAGPDSVMTLIKSLLDLKVASGELKIPNTQFATLQFFAMIKGDPQMRALLGLPPRLSASELESYLENCIDLFLHGYTD